MKVPFKHYLHDDGEDHYWQLKEATGMHLSPELLDKIGRPFYEVTLDCELDTETGEVTLIGAKL